MPIAAKLISSAVFFFLALPLPGFSAGLAPCVAWIDSGDFSYAVFNNFKALDFYGRAYRLCPHTYGALMKTTRALVDAGEDAGEKGSDAFYREAMRLTDTLRLYFPDSAQSYFLKSVAAANLFDFISGKKKLELASVVRTNAEKSIELSPTFAPAYIVLGSYYRRIATANSFQKMLARIVYGKIPTGTLQDSRRTLQAALRLSPENIYGSLELAQTFIVMGEKEEAVNLLERIPGMPNAWHLDGRLKREAADLLLKIKPHRVF